MLNNQNQKSVKLSDDMSQKELLESIFERSLSTSPFKSFPPSRRNSKAALSKRQDRSMSIASIGSVGSANLIQAYYSTEDFVAPVLDTTAELLTDPCIDYDEVTVVSCDCDDLGCRKLDKKDKNEKKNEKHPRPGALQRTRSKSRSFICNSLMGAFDNGQYLEEVESEEATESTPPTSPEGKTVNFYSFADVVNGEHDLEKFNAQPMSEYLT